MGSPDQSPYDAYNEDYSILGCIRDSFLLFWEMRLGL